MKKTIKMILYFLLLLIIILIVGGFVFMQLPLFGQIPNGERQQRIETSVNFRDGAFQNLSATPTLVKGVSFFSVLKEMLFTSKERMRPIEDIPSVTTDLLNLKRDDDVLIWLGHSSYFIQLEGKTFLIDPVLSGSASPLPFTVEAFKGSNHYRTDDLPPIDYLLITHDHWDHLDYQTVLKLKPNIKKVICGLGTGAHFERWGFAKSVILEKDWNETVAIEPGFSLNTVTARHFSGRGLWHKNRALWTSFVLQTPSIKIFIGGDSGYDTHFAQIRQVFGNFDLVILENGQYDSKWKYIHMSPEETLQAAKDLGTKRLFPVHSGKFVLSTHSWDEPLKRLTALSKETDLLLVTPIIGERVNLKDATEKFSQWWLNIK